MRNVEVEKKLKERFLGNGEKLFFVDGSKNRAFASIKSILEGYQNDSFLCVVKGENAASQIKRALYGDKETTIISTYNDFCELCRNAEIEKDFALGAEKFKNAYPHLIVVLTGLDKKPVLNKKIGVISGKAGEYNEGENASYCISDFLADAKYDFVVVDEVYELFKFSIVPENEASGYKPQNFDRINIMGQSYFTSIDYSYNKVAKIVDSAKRVILTSDILFDRDVISIYAGINLITGFSYNKAREFVKKTSFNYDEEIDAVNGSFSYCRDDIVLSLCLQLAKGNKQIIPSDLEKLSQYLTDNLDYLTREEIFLRVIYGEAKKRFNMQIASNDVIIRSLESDDFLAKTVFDVFFDDAVKGEFESSLTTSHITSMTDEDIHELLVIINKYVTYCDFADIGNRCEVVRVFHDESAFEHFIRAHHPEMDAFKNAFSASYTGSAMVFKVIATARLFEEGKIKTPLVILTEEDINEATKYLSAVFEKEVKAFTFEMENFAKDDIVVMDHRSLDAIGNYYDVGSVLFFDILSDVNFFDTCIRKMLDMSDKANAVVIASYNNLSGMLADTWQDIAFNKDYKILPARNTEVYIKGENSHDYKDVIKELNGIYESFRLLAEGEYKGKIDDLALRFSSDIANFTLSVSVMVNIVPDFEYLKKISSTVTAIFNNSISINDDGREVIREVRNEDKSSKRRRKRRSTKPGKTRKLTSYKVIEQGRKVLFDVCTEQLHETCDYTKKDCCDCEFCNKYMQNEYLTFSKSVIDFFDETYKIFEKMEMDRRAVGGIIGGGVQDQGQVSLQEILDSKEEAGKILGQLDEQKKNSPGIFYADFKKIEEIKNTVRSIYSKVFDKYYVQLQQIYENATDKMKKAFLAMGKSAKDTINTL